MEFRNCSMRPFNYNACIFLVILYPLPLLKKNKQMLATLFAYVKFYDILRKRIKPKIDRKVPS